MFHNYSMTFIALVMGVMSSIVSFFIIQNVEKQAVHDKLQNETQIIAMHIKSEILSVVEKSLISLSSFYAASNEVTRDEFHVFTQFFLNQYPYIQTLAWVPKVLHEERADYEAHAIATYPNFHFSENSPQKMLVPAAERAVYFPIYYVQPYQSNEMALGFDLGADFAYLETLNLARDNNSIQIAAPIQLTQDSQPHDLSFLAIKPMFKKNKPIDTLEQRQANLVGFVLAVFEVHSIIQSSLKQHGYQAHVNLFIQNESLPFSSHSLYRSVDVGFSNTPMFKEEFSIFNHTWSITHWQNVEENSWMPWVSLLVGLAFTLSVVWYLFSSTKHNLRLQKEVVVRKQAERKLKEREMFLRLVIDTIPQCIFWKDKNLTYLGCNQKFADVNKLSSPEAIVGQTNVKLTWQQTDEYISQDDRRIMENDIPELHQVTVFTDEKGLQQWTETNKIPLHNLKGEVVGILSTVEDITERKQAELLRKNYQRQLELEVAESTEEIAVQAEELETINDELHQHTLILREKTQQLEKEQAKFTSVLDSLESIIYVADLDTHEILFANHYAKKLFGDRILGRRCWQVLQQEQTAPCKFCEVSGLLNKSGKPTGMYTWEHQNTTNQCWYYIQDLAIQWTDGRLVRLEISTDITKLKNAQLALEQKEAYLRSFFEQPLVGMTITSPEKGFLEANDTLIRMLGYELEELKQIDWASITHPDDLALDISHFEHMLAGEIDAYTIDKRFICKNGSITHTTIAVSCSRNKYQQVDYIIGFLVDINQRKQAEIALQEAKHAADVANQAKSMFLANMSHELRTPLNGILGYAQILQTDQITERQRKGLDVIQRSGEYLLTLINDVLDLAKIEANRIELYPTHFHFCDFLRGIVELFQMRAEKKGILFRYEALSRLPEGVHADEKRLRQVIINLLTNAVKFTERGTVTFKVGYDQGNIRFQVEDTGIGIINEDLEAIFQPFQQSGNGTYKAEGTGLGLSITQRIIDMMGGELHVESTLGKGSTFWMTVKLEEVPNFESLRKKRRKYPKIIGFEESVKTILVVDNHQESQAVMFDLLSPLGFELIEASNGQVGLEKAIAINPDLIITDLIMPVMSGFELIKQLKEQPKLAKIPVIAVTARVFDYDQQQSYAAGCNAFVPKPFHADMLLTELQRLLNVTWIYEQTELVQLENSNENIENWELSSEQAHMFYDLAMQGDTLAIKEYAEELVNTDKTLRALASKIQMLADNFEDDKICSLIEPWLDEM